MDPEVWEGINCVLVLNRIQEEFELISQELVCTMSWAMGYYDYISTQIDYLKECV